MNDQVNNQIESTLAANKVVLFMKGTRTAPQCGFSASVVGILDSLVPEFATVNVLDDPQLRDGIKEFSQWPTIPQLYIDREFVGGCDIVQQMFNTGALHQALALEKPEIHTPEIHITDDAAAAILQATSHQPGVAVHLQISAAWEHQFSLSPAQGHEIKATSNGVDVLFDAMSAQRADGLSISMANTPQGAGFNINNPNAPPPVNDISPDKLKGALESNPDLYLFDVRETMELEQAKIHGSRQLDQAAVTFIETLPKDEMIVFYCHHGPRSQSAAEYFRKQGYTNLHNLTGGIDAWSLQVDPAVPRY